MNRRRACEECGRDDVPVHLHAITRKELCARCETKAPRHPDFHRPLHSAALTHIARCPQCAMRLQMRERNPAMNRERFHDR